MFQHWESPSTKEERHDSLNGCQPVYVFVILSFPFSPICFFVLLSSFFFGCDMALPLVTHARTRIFFGEKLTTVRLSNSEYLIGVELANLLRRETYNLYRSLKLLQIDVIRCVPSQVLWSQLVSLFAHFPSRLRLWHPLMLLSVVSTLYLSFLSRPASLTSNKSSAKNPVAKRWLEVSANSLVLQALLGVRIPIRPHLPHHPLLWRLPPPPTSLSLSFLTTMQILGKDSYRSLLLNSMPSPSNDTEECHVNSFPKHPSFESGSARNLFYF